MPTERIERVEERMAWLERHVTQQDKAMLEMAGLIDRLKAELTRFKQRSDNGPAGGESNPADDRPPHY